MKLNYLKLTTQFRFGKLNHGFKICTGTARATNLTKIRLDMNQIQSECTLFEFCWDEKLGNSKFSLNLLG